MLKSMVAALVVLLLSPVVSGQAPNVVMREATVTGVVERIEPSSRVLSLRLPGNILQPFYVDPAVKTFADLRTGDAVTVRYVESVVVRVRPNAPLSDLRDSTEEAREANDEVLQQYQITVTIEQIDSQGLFIMYRGADGVKVLRGVSDKRLLEGLREGDRIQVTVTWERAVSIERARQ
jgi:hypothetical protein